MTCEATKTLHEELDKIDAKFEEVLKILKKVESRLHENYLAGYQDGTWKAIRDAINIIEDEGGE